LRPGSLRKAAFPRFRLNGMIPLSGPMRARRVQTMLERGDCAASYLHEIVLGKRTISSVAARAAVCLKAAMVHFIRIMQERQALSAAIRGVMVRPTGRHQVDPAVPAIPECWGLLRQSTWSAFPVQSPGRGCRVSCWVASVFLAGGDAVGGPIPRHSSAERDKLRTVRRADCRS